MTATTSEQNGIVDPAFALLLTLDQRARTHAAGLPQQRKAQKQWHGIAFRCAGIPMLAAMHEVREVHPNSLLTVVPGTKPWVRGITSIRGTLTPVIDLAGFLGKPMKPLSSHARLLILNHPTLSAALLVDELAGLRRFIVDDFCHHSEKKPIDDAIHGLTRGYYDYREQSWAVIDFEELIKNPHFLNVAA